MNTFVILSVALCGLAIGAEALFFPVAATTGAATAVTISGGSALAGASLVGGLAVLKGLALGGLLLASAKRGSSSRGSRRYSRYHGRGKRASEEVEFEAEAEADELAFSYIAKTEPQQCYHRLICDLATGAMPSSDNDVILSLFNRETPAGSPKYEYHMAALLGKQMRNVQSCELRYTCPLSTQQIGKLFA